MRIGLLIAIERELQAFLWSGVEYAECRERGRVFFLTWENGGANEIMVLRSGCGEIDAAAGTQFLIDNGCKVILNFGVAGALDPAIEVDDLFLVEKVCHYDFDVSGIDPVEPHQYAEFSDRFMSLNTEMIAAAEKAHPELRRVAVASGDRFVVDKNFKRELFAKGCQICEMEIAAIARVCFLNGVPCLAVKSISDAYDDGAKDFEMNVERSAEKAFRVLRSIITEICSQ